MAKSLDKAASAAVQRTPPIPRRSVLFRPGEGQSPKCLAGREPERVVLDNVLDALRCGESPSHNVVLHAPRGLGKTVLLAALEKAAEGITEQGGVRVIRAAASEIETLPHLYALTLGQRIPTSASAMAETGRGAKGECCGAQA